MKNKHEARTHKSETVRKIMEKNSPVERERVRNKMKLAAKIADLINEKGLSKREFAKIVGKNPSEITRWVSGTHNLTMNTLTEIAFALNISVEDFFSAKKELIKS